MKKEKEQTVDTHNHMKSKYLNDWLLENHLHVCP